jgi:signal transduction histidine kinase
LFKAFIKHYLLIVVGIVSSILVADYWYTKNALPQSAVPLTINHVVPLIKQYCQQHDCIEGDIPLTIPSVLVDKQLIMFPTEQMHKLTAGEIITVLDPDDGNYHYINYDEDYYLQLGPNTLESAPNNNFYTTVFYVLLAAALFIGFYPLFRDMGRLSDVVRKFENKQALNSSDFPDSAYFQQIFSAIREMLEKIGRLVALQKELSDTLSHEVRTSLSSAKFTLTAIDDKNYQQMKPLLDGDISDIERLVQEYLSFSKQEHQCPSLELSAQSPTVIIDEYAEKLLRFSDKKVTLVKKTDAVALIDRRYFSRVVKNLIDNALKHADSEIVISVLQESEVLILQIEDDGRGLLSDKLEDLFLPFNREHDEVAGYGLGLAIAKKIVDWHHGEIKAANSTQLSGAKFTVKLPCCDPDNDKIYNQSIDQLSHAEK